MSALTDQRPWGHYTVLADEADHKVKRIVVQPGKRLSLQRHQQRAEHWYVVKGEALVTLDESEKILSAGNAVDSPIRTKHRIENTGSEELVLLKSKPAATLEKMTLNASMTTSAELADPSPHLCSVTEKTQLTDAHFVD